jgi:hypothetical protein
MLKNKIKYVFLFTLFFLNNLSGQEKSSPNTHLPKSGDGDFYSTTYPSVEKCAAKIHPLNYNAFDLKVTEVADTNMSFAYNGGGTSMGYCGNVKGGIINLLQKTTGVTSHIRFLNEPTNERYVLFYGQGMYMNGSAVMDTASQIGCYGHITFNGRDMIMTMMANLFNFEIKQIEDSLEVLKLRVVDNSKLHVYQKTLQDCPHGGRTYFDTANKDFHGKCVPTIMLVSGIESSLNIFIYNEVNTGKSNYFTFIIPHELLESYEKIDELNQYLETKMGLTLKKEKALEKVYTIRFNNE